PPLLPQAIDRDEGAPDADLRLQPPPPAPRGHDRSTGGAGGVEVRIAPRHPESAAKHPPALTLSGERGILKRSIIRRAPEALLHIWPLLRLASGRIGALPRRPAETKACFATSSGRARACSASSASSRRWPRPTAPCSSSGRAEPARS